MGHEIEIEFKNLLTKEEFTRLMDAFSIEESMFQTQINHYFDDSYFQLKGLSSALRIREKKNGFELTLKQPAQVGLLETNQSLPKELAQAVLAGAPIPDGIVKEELEKLGISTIGLQYFGALKTKRTELQYRGGLLVFDHSFYLSKEDYELEYEVQDPEAGEAEFNRLLHTYNIPIRPTDNKIKRFYKQKYALG